MTNSGEGLLPDERLEDIPVAPGGENADNKRENVKNIDDAHEDEEGREAPKDAPASDKNLDDGLEDSMDGSDPPSSTQP